MEQGLPSNAPIKALVDRKGFLWVTSKGGLSRYDGYSFTSYQFDPRDSFSLNQNVTFTLYEDDEGILWVSTVEGGINRFDAATGKFFNYRPEQPVGRFETVLRAVSAMQQDKEGFFWVGSYSGELRRFDKRTGRFTTFDYDLGYHPRRGDIRPFDRVNCIYRDSHNDIWLGNKSGLHRLVITPGKSPLDSSACHFSHYINDPADSNSLAGDEVAGIFEDHAGKLWVGTDSALNRLDRNTGHFIHYRPIPGDSHSFPGETFGGIVEDNDHYLWIATSHAVSRLDPDRKTFENFRNIPGDANSLGISYGYTIAVDKPGNIWICGGNGINKFDPHQIPMIRYKHDEHDPFSLISDRVGAVYEDHRGMVWFATDAGLDVLDKKTGRFRHYRHDPHNVGSLGDNMVSSVIEDDEGMMWVTSWMGTVDRLDPVTGRCTHYIGENGLFKNAGRHIYNLLYKDSHGVIWIGEASSGVTALEYRKNQIRHYGHDPADPDGMSDYQTDCICEDKAGYIWIGHGSVATDRLDPRTGRFKHFQYHFRDTAGISSNYVNAIVRDRKDNLWIGTQGGGLCRWRGETETFVRYTEKDGLRNNDINSIVEDDAGDLWLGTSKGICRFNPDNQQFTYFDFINSSRTNREVQIYCKGRDGLLYLSGESVMVFDPAGLQPNRYIPPVVITQFRIFNKPRPVSDEVKKVELAHNENFFSFGFSVLNYTDGSKNQYAYMLEGVDKDWIYSGARRTAEYTDVAPGTYVFRVKGSNNEGLWNNAGVSLVIIVRPPWWRTWWAWSLYIIGAGVGWWGFDSRRKRRLIVRERERGRARELEMQALRAQMNPHFIFNSLSSINRFILKSDTDAASDYLTKFSRLIRLVLNNSKKPLIPLEDELEMLRLYLDLEKLRFKEAFVYCIDIGPHVDLAGIAVPPLVFQPFAENAIWHGLMHKQGPGRLDIQLLEKGDRLICIIADDGVGRSFAASATSKSAEKQKSMGMEITKQRLALINSDDRDCLAIEDLYDESGNGAGTKVILKIRVREVVT